jgi:flagellar biosynthesis protein FliP
MEKEKNNFLNKLIISNNDRIKGYQAAAKETEEQDLKSFYTINNYKSKMQSRIEGEIRAALPAFIKALKVIRI